MKKVFLCIALLLVAALILAACNRGGEGDTPAPIATPTPAAAPAADQNDDDDNGDEYQDATGIQFPERIRIYGNLDGRAFRAGAECNNDIVSWQELEARTGTVVEWILIPQGADWEMDLNLLIASRDLPDLIRQGWPGVPGGPNAFFEDGVIICLREIIASNMPNFRQIMDERNAWPSITYNEDNIFFIPEVRREIEMAVWRGPVIRGDWLDQLGLPIPQTLDELHQTLIAFRDERPGGQDVWAMSGMTLGTGNTFDLAQLFFPFGIHFRFFQVYGEVRFGPNEPEFADAMAFLNMLFMDGLIDPDYEAQDRGQLDGKFMNDMVGFMFGPQPTMLNATMEGTDTNFRAEGIPWFSRTAGSPRYVFWADYDSYLGTFASVAITSQAQNVDLIANWLDFLFTENEISVVHRSVEWHKGR